MQALPLGHAAGLQEVSGCNTTCATVAFPDCESLAFFLHTTPLPGIMAGL